MRHSLGWCCPKLVKRSTPSRGFGLFALESIAKDELLVLWGGIVVTTEELLKLPEFARQRAIQVEQNLHLSAGTIDDVADCVNHSCDPTAGLSGQVGLVAMRDIYVGEEICFDYAMSDTYSEFSLPCECGHAACRKLVTGEDWKRPDLQERYKGYFSPYIQRMIDAVKAETSVWR